MQKRQGRGKAQGKNTKASLVILLSYVICDLINTININYYNSRAHTCAFWNEFMPLITPGTNACESSTAFPHLILPQIIKSPKNIQNIS